VSPRIRGELPAPAFLCVLFRCAAGWARPPERLPGSYLHDATEVPHQTFDRRHRKSERLPARRLTLLAPLVAQKRNPLHALHIHLQLMDGRSKNQDRRPQATPRCPRRATGTRTIRGAQAPRLTSCFGLRQPARTPGSLQSESTGSTTSSTPVSSPTRLRPAAPPTQARIHK